MLIKSSKRYFFEDFATKCDRIINLCLSKQKNQEQKWLKIAYMRDYLRNINFDVPKKWIFMKVSTDFRPLASIGQI